MNVPEHIKPFWYKFQNSDSCVEGANSVFQASYQIGNNEAVVSGYVETPWVVDLGAGRYRMDNCPFYFYGIAAGDIVGAKYCKKEEQLILTHVVEKSGNKLVRVIFEKPTNIDGVEKYHLDALVAMGCSYKGGNSKYICTDIPKSVELFDI